MENIIRSLYNDGIEYIKETVREMSLYTRQIFFVNCMKIIDKSYYDYVMLKSDESAKFFFESIVATPLAHADENEIYRCRVFLCSCKVVGQTEHVLDMEKYGHVSIDSENDICIIKCRQKLTQVFTSLCNRTYATFLYADSPDSLRKSTQLTIKLV